MPLVSMIKDNVKDISSRKAYVVPSRWRGMHIYIPSQYPQTNLCLTYCKTCLPLKYAHLMIGSDIDQSILFLRHGDPFQPGSTSDLHIKACTICALIGISGPKGSSATGSDSSVQQAVLSRYLNKGHECGAQHLNFRDCYRLPASLSVPLSYMHHGLYQVAP